MNTPSDTPRQPITAREVTDMQERIECLPKHFGRRLPIVEDAVYVFLRHLSHEYKGFWKYYELSNGGFYMAPEGQSFAIAVPANGFSGTMSADAAGITACLFALSHLSFQFRTEVISNHFYQLREFVLEHAERSAILAAID
jgi:hypothetical protein